MLIHNLIDKYRGISPTVKCAIWFTICNMIIRGISFISAPLFTRVLSEEEYGKLAVLNSYEAVLLILATWDIAPGAFQRGMIKYKDSLKLFWTTSQTLTTLITLSFAMVIYIGIYFFGFLEDISNIIWIGWFLYFFVQPANQCWIIYNRSEFKYKAPIIFSIIYSLLYFVIPYICVVYFGKTAEIKVVSSMIMSVIMYLPFYVRNANIKLIIKNINSAVEQVKFILKFQIPCIANSLSLVVLSSADRIMIGNLCGNEQVAYYTVAYTIAFVISVLQISINQVLTPWRYKKLDEKDYDAITKSTNGLLLCIGVLIILFVLIVPDGIRIFFPEKYYEAIWCVPPVSASIFFMLLYSIFVNVETYFNDTKYIMYIAIVCSAVNVILNYYAIKLFGYISCAYTTLISYLLFAILHFIFMSRICSQNSLKTKLFDKKIILGISLFIIFFTVFITLAYDSIFYRYIIFTIILTSCYVIRRRIKTFVFTYFVNTHKSKYEE